MREGKEEAGIGEGGKGEGEGMGGWEGRVRKGEWEKGK